MTRTRSRRAAVVRVAGASAAAAALTASLLAAGSPAQAGQKAPGSQNGSIGFGRFDPELGAPSLWVADPDGSDQRRLTDVPTFFSDWSPDGSRIAFDFEDDSGVHIATTTPDGSVQEVLTSAPGVQETPKWSPDGQWITYGSYDPAQEEFSTSIWVMRTDGSDARQVTFDGFDVEPVFSPDGSRIAFGRIVVDGPRWLEAIYVINTDGTGLRQVVPARAGLEHPDWSPDGRWITFNIEGSIADAPDAGAVLAVRPDGKALHVLRAATARYRFFKPVWAPDGRELLMGCYDVELGRDLLCKTTRGGGRLRVVDLGGTAPVNFPSWGSHQG